jgi:23S rRNA pseudouridine2457 synthase
MATLLFYKPYGVLSQFGDENGHPGLAHYIERPGIYAAGRLDHDSEGLLLLTDDNWLKTRLTDPRFAHRKTYWAQVEGLPSKEAVTALEQGVWVQGKRTRPAQATCLASAPDLPPRTPPIRYRANIPTTWLELVLSEGRNRQVRRMTAAVGHPTLRLVRCAIGPCRLDGLEPGQSKLLSQQEESLLKERLRTGWHR